MRQAKTRALAARRRRRPSRNQPQRRPTFELLEVKMLRMLQADLNERTTEYQRAARRLRIAARRSATARNWSRKPSELAAEQGRLAELVQKMLTRDNEEGERVESQDASSRIETMRLLLAHYSVRSSRRRANVAGCGNVTSRRQPAPNPSASELLDDLTPTAQQPNARPLEDRTNRRTARQSRHAPTPRFDDLGDDIGQPSGPLSLARVQQGMQNAQSLLAPTRRRHKYQARSNRRAPCSKSRRPAR